MKKGTVRASIAIALLAAGPLFAQSKVNVRGGDRFSYNADSELNITQLMQGQEMSVKLTSKGTTELMVKKTGKDRIQWSIGMPSMHITTTSDMMPGAGMDTSFSSEPADFVTDLKGNVIEEPKISENMLKTFSGLQGGGLEQMFLPATAKSSRQGDTWEVTETDTVPNPMLAGSDMYIERTTTYYYDGPVDTMQTRAVRIRAEVTSMSISGSSEMMGAQISVEGDGDMSTTSYFSEKDGLLLSSRASGVISLRLVVTSESETEVVPIEYAMSATTTRN